MLVRSPRTPDISTNIDIVFWDVLYVALRTTLVGITLEKGSLGDVDAIERAIGVRCDAGLVYRLLSGDTAFLVIASGFKVLQNELDICDSTLVDIGMGRPVEELGQVLCHS